MQRVLDSTFPGGQAGGCTGAWLGRGVRCGHIRGRWAGRAGWWAGCLGGGGRGWRSRSPRQSPPLRCFAPRVPAIRITTTGPIHCTAWRSSERPAPRLHSSPRPRPLPPPTRVSVQLAPQPSKIGKGRVANLVFGVPPTLAGGCMTGRGGVSGWRQASTYAQGLGRTRRAEKASAANPPAQCAARPPPALPPPPRPVVEGIFVSAGLCRGQRVPSACAHRLSTPPPDRRLLRAPAATEWPDAPAM